MHKVTVFYRDYKTVNGLTMPHTLETAVERRQAVAQDDHPEAWP